MSKVMTKAEPLVKILNKEVANCSVLYMKLHNYHWFVKGESFFDLHIKFEELYTEMGLHLDTIAERILAIGEQPTATLKEILASASIKEAAGNESALQMVKQLVTDFETISKELTEGIETAEEAKDQPTSDMLVAIRTSLEKHVWMFKAFQAK
jgi:starvation-inducible DNA-binding protein